MSIKDETVSFSLEVNVQKAYEEIRRLQTVAYRALALIRRFGLPENVEEAIINIQRLITILNRLRLTMIMVQTAAGPIGWALAGITVVETVWTLAEVS